MDRFGARDAALRTKRPPTRPMISAGPTPRPLAAYAGGFDNPAYGRMNIRARADGGLEQFLV